MWSVKFIRVSPGETWCLACVANKDAVGGVRSQHIHSKRMIVVDFQTPCMPAVPRTRKSEPSSFRRLPSSHKRGDVYPLRRSSGLCTFFPWPFFSHGYTPSTVDESRSRGLCSLKPHTAVPHGPNVQGQEK